MKTEGEFEMVEQGKSVNNRNMHAIILSVLGILLLIVGAYIINVRGAPLRGIHFLFFLY